MPENHPIQYSGSAAVHYEKYQGPVFFEPYAQEVAIRIDPSAIQVALEIACGTGRVTRQLRKALAPSATLIATDISEGMLDVAKAELKGLAIDWQVADAQDLPFDDNSVDLVVCCFGYMFLPDKIKGFKEAYRVLRSGGTLIFTTWDKLELNGASHVHRTVIKKYLGGGDLPESYMTAFAINKDVEITAWLKAAGFQKISVEHVEKRATHPSAKYVADGLACGGPICNEIFKKNRDWVPKIQAEIQQQLTEKYGDAPMNSPMCALITTAKK